jgi:hypothetical protein
MFLQGNMPLRFILVIEIRAGILKWNSLRGVAGEVMVVEDEMRRQQCDPRKSVGCCPVSSEG